MRQTLFPRGVIHSSRQAPVTDQTCWRRTRLHAMVYRVISGERRRSREISRVSGHWCHDGEGALSRTLPVSRHPLLTHWSSFNHWTVDQGIGHNIVGYITMLGNERAGASHPRCCLSLRSSVAQGGALKTRQTVRGTITPASF